MLLFHQTLLVDRSHHTRATMKAILTREALFSRFHQCGSRQSQQQLLLLLLQAMIIFSNTIHLR
jgi:hypothetical protein